MDNKPPSPQATGYYVAVDLGQAADYTAVVVNERAQAFESGKTVVHHRIRYLHRYALGTTYPAIVDSVRRLVAQLPEMPQKPELLIDQTGVGRAVGDIFREAGMYPVGISITGGSSVNRVSQWDVRVPKRELASITQAILQTGRIAIAHDVPFAQTLEDELSNFKVRITQTGSEQFEGRTGVHDDLVLSLAIALWAAEGRHNAAGMSMLELARRDLAKMGTERGAPPQKIQRTYAIGSVEWQAQEDAKRAETAVKSD